MPDDLLGNTFNPAGKWAQEMKKASYHPNQKKAVTKAQEYGARILLSGVAAARVSFLGATFDLGAPLNAIGAAYGQYLYFFNAYLKTVQEIC